jgi:tetratricopeptide (TPR) repeat protein
MNRLTLCLVLLGIAGCGPVAPKENTDAEDVSTPGKEADPAKTEAELDKAITDSTEAIRIKPEDVLAHLLRGFAYAYKHDFDRAIADYTEAIRLDPTNAVAYYNRGLAYKGLDEKVKAEADLARGRELGFKD